MDLQNEILALTEKLNGLEKSYEQIFQQTLHNELMFWTIILGIFGIISIALYFIARSLMQNGVEKGINKVLENNKLKLDKSNPEITGTLQLTNSDRDNSNIRLVKMKDEPVVNIESDKSDAVFTINHKDVLTDNSFVFNSTLFNGWSGKSIVFVEEHRRYKLVEIIFEDLSGGVWTNGTVISRLPKGYGPKTKIKFKGYNNENVEVLFTINTDGSITLTTFGGAMKNINGHVVFIVHDYDIS